mgnify:CR=1 FL=1
MVHIIRKLLSDWRIYMNRLNVLILILLQSLIFSCIHSQISTQEDSWYTGTPARNNDTVIEEIERERIIPVASSQLKNAIALLEVDSFIQIDMAMAETLTSQTNLDPDKILKEYSSNASARAKALEQQANNPKNSSSREQILANAEQYAKKAVHAHGLIGKLKPYLVRAVILNEGTGGYFAYWLDSALVIGHGSLGRYPVPMKRHPVIIFLEKEPTALFTEVSMAQ